MYNIILINNDFKFISRIIKIIYSINDLKIKHLFYSYDNNLRSTFVDFSNVYILSEDTYSKYYNKLPYRKLLG